jgi:Flp pilus assembly protein TadD
MRGVSRAILFVLSAFAVSAQVTYANIPEEDEVESTGPNFEAAVRAIENKDWNAAIESLNKAEEKSKDNADIHNLLGYAYRNLRKYEQAIKLNPRHRSARGYLGEAYLLTNNLAKAQDEFRRLEDLCPRGCQQLDMLKAKYRGIQEEVGEQLG